MARTIDQTTITEAIRQARKLKEPVYIIWDPGWQIETIATPPGKYGGTGSSYRVAGTYSDLVFWYPGESAAAEVFPDGTVDAG